jgi:hypothetical protein
LIVENTAAFSAAVDKEAAAPQQNTRAVDANWQSFLFFTAAAHTKRQSIFNANNRKKR